MKNKKFKELYNNFLKNKIKEYCNEQKCCVINWDYRDCFDPGDLLCAYKKSKEEGYERIEDYIAEQLIEMNMDYDSDLLTAIENDMKNESFYTKKFETWYEEKCHLFDDLIKNGYNGIDINLDELLNNSNYLFNIMLGTAEERNSDMSNIIRTFGSYRLPDFEYMQPEDFDNSLTYLIHQQGHTCKEYFDTLINNPRGYKRQYECKFIESIVDETVNCSAESMSELTILVKMNGKEAVEFLNYLLDNENNLNLIFDKNSELGMFNEWIGTGGLLGIALEKDFIVPKNMIRGFQIEGTKNQSYTVDEVYGLVRSCWKECMNYTKEEPELMIEDIEETIKHAQYINREIEEVI